MVGNQKLEYFRNHNNDMAGYTFFEIDDVVACIKEMALDLENTIFRHLVRDAIRKFSATRYHLESSRYEISSPLIERG